MTARRTIAAKHLIAEFFRKLIIENINQAAIMHISGAEIVMVGAIQYVSVPRNVHMPKR